MEQGFGVHQLVCAGVRCGVVWPWCGVRKGQIRGKFVSMYRTPKAHTGANQEKISVAGEKGFYR